MKIFSKNKPIYLYISNFCCTFAAKYSALAGPVPTYCTIKKVKSNYTQVGVVRIFYPHSHKKKITNKRFTLMRNTNQFSSFSRNFSPNFSRCVRFTHVFYQGYEAKSRISFYWRMGTLFLTEERKYTRREPSFQVGSLSCMRAIQYSRYISPISFQIFFSFKGRLRVGKKFQCSLPSFA